MNFSMKFMRPKSDARRPPVPAALVCRGRRNVFRREGQRRAAARLVHFDDPRSAAKPLTRDEARRIAANVAKLPALLKTGEARVGSEPQLS